MTLTQNVLTQMLVMVSGASLSFNSYCFSYRATTPLIAGYPTYLTSPQGVLATALPPSATAGGSAAAQFAAIDYSAIPGQFAAGTAAAYDASVYATYGNAGAASQYALPYAGYALPQHLVGAGGTYAAYQQPIGERLQ